ncbi:MAG: transposase [Planctomycetaceae bacterium]
MSKSNGSSKSGGRVRRSFSEEFKRDAVSLVTEQGYSLAEAARSLGLHQNLIRNWRLKFVSKEKKSQGLNEDEKAELKRLREENRKLRMERDILKKATAFFAKESQ